MASLISLSQLCVHQKQLTIDLEDSRRSAESVTASALSVSDSVRATTDFNKDINLSIISLQPYVWFGFFITELFINILN